MGECLRNEPRRIPPEGAALSHAFSQMTDVTNRAAMIDLAAIWMRLARQAELNEHLVKQLEQAQRA
jgi:hypothetical protein